jgi:hypothetical protein
VEQLGRIVVTLVDDEQKVKKNNSCERFGTRRG